MGSIVPYKAPIEVTEPQEGLYSFNGLGRVPLANSQRLFRVKERAKEVVKKRQELENSWRRTKENQAR